MERPGISPQLVEEARVRLAQIPPYSVTKNIAENPGAAFGAFIMGGLLIGWVLVVVAMLFGAEAFGLVFLGPFIAMAWVSAQENKRREEKLERVRTGSPAYIANAYCSSVSENEDPALWRALDGFRRRLRE